MSGLTVRVTMRSGALGRMVGLALVRGERPVYRWSGVLRPGDTLRGLIRRAYADYCAGYTPGQTVH